MPERVIELRVRNHPGAMSHITGLFARRSFNIERILCVPQAAGDTSRILLAVRDEVRIDQILRQAARLHDVLEVRSRTEEGAAFFSRLAAAIGES